MRKDPVTPELRRAILIRDGGCMAPVLDPGVGLCRDMFGTPHHRGYAPMLTLDHVKDAPRMGVRSSSDPDHLVTLCYHHHVGTEAGSNWATSHRALLRAYLAQKRPQSTQEG